MPSALKRAVGGFRTGQVVFRDANRFRQIVMVLARHGFGAALERMRVGDAGLLSKVAEMRLSDDEAIPLERRILHALQELGPTFVKLGQILSTRPDVVPAKLIEQLKTLQDQVPPMTLEDVYTVIEEDLERTVDDIFAEFDDEPLACASIAQVHRAVLPTGEEVVVKVQRRGIRPQIEADVEIMGFLARAAEENFPEMQTLSPTGVVAEFEKAILKEIDFRQELDHIGRFRRNFEGVPGVHFPDPQPHLTTSRVIVMEMIRAIKITEMTEPAYDVEAVVEVGTEAIVKMIFEDGFFHGDVHPGNLLVRPDGTLCFIDFGLCGRLTRKQRDLLVDLLVAVVREDYEGVGRVFWKIAIHGEDSTHDFDAFQQDAVEVVERWFAGKTMDELEFSGFLKDLVDGAAKHRVRMPTAYTMTFKALITMEGVAKQIAPGTDIIRVARPYVLRMAQERYSPQNMTKVALDTARDLGETLQALPQTARMVLDDLRAGRTQVRMELTQLRQMQRTWSRAQGRHGLALLASASALSGTLGLSHTEHSVLGFPAVSFWFYVLAGLLTLWFIASGRFPSDED